MVLNTAPCPFLQPPESHYPQTCPSSPQQMNQEAEDQWKQLALSLFVHFSFQQGCIAEVLGAAAAQQF